MLIAAAVIHIVTGGKVDVPLVEGKLLKEAQATLQASGLTSTVREIRHCGRTPDLVLRQEPQSGSVSRGANVQLTVVKKREPVPAPAIGGSGELRTLSPGQRNAANAWAFKGTGIMFGLEGDDCTEGVVTVTHSLGKGTWSYPMKSGQRKDASEFYGAGKLTVLFASDNPAARLKVKIW